jgi:hypothetical protein
MLFAIASTLFISPLNFSNLAGGAGFVSAGLVGAGAGVVSVFGGTAAMAPEIKATNVSRTTNRIAFFIQIHLPSYQFLVKRNAYGMPKQVKKNIF